MTIMITETTVKDTRDVIVEWLKYCAKVEGNKLPTDEIPGEFSRYASRMIDELAKQLSEVPIVDPQETEVDRTQMGC